MTKKEMPVIPFPENVLGLVRGSVLTSQIMRPEIITLTGVGYIREGEAIILGFDGRYVCYGENQWSIEELVEEIMHGMWELSGDILDELEDPECRDAFRRDIERIVPDTGVYH